LRTVKQLGYVATCYSSTHSNVISFELLVQSGTYNPDVILSTMNEFLDNFYHNELMQLITNDKFNDAKLSYIDLITRKDLTLNDKTNSLWNYIALNLFQFDIHSQVVPVVKSITGEDLKNFYNNVILQTTTHRKMVISIFGYPSDPQYISNATAVDYGDIDNFKSGASFYKADNC